MNEGLQMISNSQALKKGAHLWIVSDSQNSSWHCQIDWYLCFQIKKSKLKHFDEIDQYTQSLLEKYALPSFQWKKPHPPIPILIESADYLPNLWTMQMDYTEEWIDKIYNIWASLNEPKLRIFVPQPIKKEKIIEKWEEHSKNNLIQYIME